MAALLAEQPEKEKTMDTEKYAEWIYEHYKQLSEHLEEIKDREEENKRQLQLARDAASELEEATAASIASYNESIVTKGDSSLFKGASKKRK